ncbi:hypothetical protein BDN67DRAFT_906254 [Paxillus ammoniavirescens]|nr:hypothetical protein BDN67DRAFT_906254 [Paxillus ammoniavirescens]
MAALVAPNNPTILPAPPGSGGINKRYRPAPAKTFQCRGYGECRMVFSRSEHLARHIRKHTGERPFTCHCAKQFSRLDNLRQHAQTVHADKQDQNERMMRELTSLHASMAAATKTGQTRGKRGQAALNAAAVVAATSSQDNGMRPLDQVKEEDMPPTAIPMHQRPGTSTGYEGGDSVMYDDGWNPDIDRGHPRPPNNHSFRDSSQSFRVPPASNTSSFYGQQQSQSFLPFSNTFSFALSSRDGRPGSSSSRPPTAGGPDSHARTLPPLAAVVSATISPPSNQQFPFQPQSTQHILPLPGTAAFNRRPASVNRPGTAPASYYASKPAYAGGPGLVHQPELSLPVYGRSGELAAAAATAAAYHNNPYEADPPSPTAGSYDSPFSFHPPALAESATFVGFAPSPPGNPRKRPFSGVDGAPDEGPRREPSSGLSGLGEYEYESESRPQSRRLTVLELCNDPDADVGVRSFLPGAAGSASRPTTSSGLVSSASALALVDRTPVPSYSLLPGAPQTTTSATPSAAVPTGSGPTAFGGGRVSPALRRDAPSPSTASAVPSQLLTAHRGHFSASSLSPASRSPRSQPSSAALTAVARSVSIRSNSSSPSSNGATPPALSRRGESQHEVRSPVTATYSPAALGMKV